MITFNTVTKQFGDGTVALDRVSFHIEPGELVVITGPSGSGKTTLMKLLIRDFPPSEGEIIFKDQSLADMQAADLPKHRRRIGVVFQDYRLLPELNVWENIALPLSIAGKSEAEIESRVTDLLNLVSLTDRALVFPKQLSGGEAQRASIARALAMGPSVIFADEPTGNLDKDSSLRIMKLFEQINSLGTTVLLATHDVTLLDLLQKERQLSLEKGKLVHDSKPKKMPEIIESAEESESEKSEEPEKPQEEESKEEKPKKEPKAKKKAKKAEKTKEKLPKPDEGEVKVEETDLADEFEEPKLEKTSPEKAEKPGWLKSLTTKVPSIPLPKFGTKEGREKEEKEKETQEEKDDQ